MALDYDKLMNLDLPDLEFSYGDRETMLYNLGIGLGADPMNRRELPFVFEKDLKTVPSMATVIVWDDRWAEGSGVNRVMIVHGEQRIRLHRPLPVSATILSNPRITGIFDKGADKGAVILIENVIRDKATNEPLCTNLSTVFARGDGGFGGPKGGGPAPHQLPGRAPDMTVDYATRPDQALLYRLCGDRNPLHADPDFAAEAGFPRPILHGLCTYGHACRAVVEKACDLDPTRLVAFEGRFSSPVFPGETIRTEMWRDGETISFRSRLVERDAVVINNGKATLSS